MPAAKITLPILLSLALTGCYDNRTPQETAEAGALFECIPNLDGSLDAAEFRLTAGQRGDYDITLLRDVDSAGAGAAEARSWAFDWTRDDDDTFVLEVTRAADAWFADRIPDALYDRFDGELVALPADIDGRYQLIMGKDDVSTWLLGTASTDESPDDEGPMWLLYDEPVAIHRFPLTPGGRWTSVGESSGATLPIPGTPEITVTEDRRDTYEVSVTDVGEVDLGPYRFERVVKVEQRVTLEFPANPLLPASVQLQVQYFAECGGEVARLTARQNDEAEPIELAGEVRRARL